MKRVLPTAAVALALTACDRPAEPAKASPPPVAAKVAPKSPWAFGLGKNSVEMAWLAQPESATASLRLICARGDGMMVVVSAFKPIASEERLSIGAGDEVVALVATPGEAPPVRATGPVDEKLLAAIQGGKPIAASYGAQTLGPIEAPPAAMRAAFADMCRSLYRRGAV